MWVRLITGPCARARATSYAPPMPRYSKRCLISSALNTVAHDVQQLMIPGLRYPHPRDEREARTRGRLPRLGDAGGLIVIGEGQPIHALRTGVRHQGAGAQGAVGRGGMTMKIVAHGHGYGITRAGVGFIGTAVESLFTLPQSARSGL